jgi:hypothetical protein
MKKINIYSFFVILILLFVFAGCSSNSDTENKSDVRVSLAGYNFTLNTCTNGIDPALSSEIKAAFKNFSKIPGNIEFWKFNIYKNDTLLLIIDKNNFENLACAQQQLTLDSPIIETGWIELYGFMKYDLFGDMPNKIEIIVTIKDDSGYTYEISDTY